MKKVSIQGIKGSFHEDAARRYFNDEIEVVECKSFRKVCEQIDEDKVDYAVLAIENSIAGSILQNYSLIRDYHLRVIGEIYNIGSDDHHEYTVTQIANMLIEKITKTIDYDKWISHIEDRPFNDKRYYISNQKVKDLGWTILTDFDNGIDEVIQSMSK